MNSKKLSLVAAFVAGAVFLGALPAAAGPCSRAPPYCQRNGSGGYKAPDLTKPAGDKEIQEEISCYFAAKKLEAVILNSISNEKALEEAKALLSGLASLCLQAETQESL